VSSQQPPISIFELSIFERLLLAYFAISGLDVLCRLNELPFDKNNIVDWIYQHQIIKPVHSKFVGSLKVQNIFIVFTERRT
jgi:hypothetical protein